MGVRLRLASSVSAIRRVAAARGVGNWQFTLHGDRVPRCPSSVPLPQLSVPFGRARAFGSGLGDAGRGGRLADLWADAPPVGFRAGGPGAVPSPGSAVYGGGQYGRPGSAAADLANRH